jgi:hypothetical protein
VVATITGSTKPTPGATSQSEPLPAPDSAGTVFGTGRKGRVRTSFSRPRNHLPAPVFPTKSQAMKNKSSHPPFAAALGGLAVAALLVAGCVVESIYPYYTLKDVIVDSALAGAWNKTDKGDATSEIWTFAPATNQTYQLTVRDSNETNHFDVHLFTLSDQKFLDCLPRERRAYQTPNHVLLRVKQIQPALEMELLDYDWLTKLVAAKPKAIRHLVVPKEADGSDDGGMLTLTADTAELQKFLRKHLKNPEAWGEPLVMKKL